MLLTPALQTRLPAPAGGGSGGGAAGPGGTKEAVGRYVQHLLDAPFRDNLITKDDYK